MLLPSKSPNDLTLEFAPAGTALRGLAVPQSGSALATMAAPPPPPVAESGGAQAQPQQTAAQPVAASVTAVDAAATDDGGATIHVTVNGGADYEWHRLRDQRWYVDIRGATLGMAPRDERRPSARSPGCAFASSRSPPSRSCASRLACNPSARSRSRRPTTA